MSADLSTHYARHPGEGRGPAFRWVAVRSWIPAFTGMTAVFGDDAIPTELHPLPVMPAKAGIPLCRAMKRGSGFRRNDGRSGGFTE